MFADKQASARPWLVMGDSLSAAYGIDVSQGWVALLAERLGDIPVVNASISGETTSGGKQRLGALMQQYQPEVLVLELGANDALRGQDLSTSKQNLQSMINQCLEQQEKCQVVLLGIRLPTNYGPAYDQYLQLIYQQLAQQHKLLFDPFFIEDAALDPDLMQDDALHPNRQAQPIIADRIYQLIKPLLKAD
ncbi:arylesterase [Thiomicrorhabdus sediminis]|uniref:Arylesterase n=2 Tax=Thiomicrorhabdus sediminis TaxID=2580412 RepID=A0A4P9K862_9GAMM|nr:arylesterase [Thiomicrorhabdus sediminis]